MITATCSGRGCARIAASSRASSISAAAAERRDWSGAIDDVIRLDGENFLFLFLEQLVHPRAEAVGRLLDLLVRAPLLVLGDLLVLGQSLELVVGLAAHVADGDAALFRHLAHGLGQLLAALLRQRGYHQPDQLAVVHRG